MLPPTPLTADPAAPQGQTRHDAASAEKGPAPRLRRELLLIAVFYVLYTAIRDLRGTRPVSVALAYHHAEWIIRLERAVGVFHEAQLEHFFLHDHFVVEVLDVWYGSTHFVVTAVVLAILFFRHPARYRIGRNALAVATILALVGFAFFPLMPPRLLPPSFGFVDTLRDVGGLWAFNSGPMPDLSNQFAAMPSLHFAWALWCGVVLIPVLRRWWAKVLVACYPAITLLCVIATGNHYVMDVVAGVLTVAVGYGVSVVVDSLRRAQTSRLLARRTPGGP
jgi:hypothetical protein